MNIFALDDDPVKAAQALCDQHVGKMLLETCQLLCNCHAEVPYKRTHFNHPCSVWARASLHNYLWLRKHALALAAEYEHRFGKVHGSRTVAVWAAQHLPINIPNVAQTPFAQAMPEQYLGPDAVAAYRRYYAAEKMILRGKPVTWTRREQPAWLRGEIK